MAKLPGTLVPTDVVGSVSSRGLLLHLSTTDMTLLHQRESRPGIFDRIKIYAINIDTSDRDVSIFWGATEDPISKISMRLPAYAGPCLIVDDWPIERGLPVYAKAATAATINIVTLINPATFI